MLRHLIGIDAAIAATAHYKSLFVLTTNEPNSSSSSSSGNENSTTFINAERVISFDSQVLSGVSPAAASSILNDDDIDLGASASSSASSMFNTSSIGYASISKPTRRYHRFLLKVTKDPVTSKDAILVNESDITEQILAQEQAVSAASAKLKAELESKAKSEFLGTLSHEVRTPMNGIIGFTEILMNSGGLNDDQRKYCNYVLKSSHILSSIINNIFQFTKLEKHTKQRQQQRLQYKLRQRQLQQHQQQQQQKRNAAMHNANNNIIVIIISSHNSNETTSLFAAIAYIIVVFYHM